MTTRADIAVCVPAGDEVKTLFALNLLHLAARTTDGGTVGLCVLCVKDTIIQVARHALVRKALDEVQGVTHVLFIDSDMTFPDDAALRLLAHDQDIVACGAATRRTPVKPTMYAPDESLYYLTEGDTGLLEVGYVGCALMLIRTEVFRRVSEPWFHVEWNAEHGLFGCEDFYFCDRARAAGYHIYVDCELSREIGHLGEFAYTLAHATEYLAMVEAREAGRHGILTSAPHAERQRRRGPLGLSL